MLEFDSSNVKFAERFSLALGSRTALWLHEQTGIPTSTLSNYRKKGLIPAADAACRIAIALGVDVTWLVLGIGEMRPSGAVIPYVNTSLDPQALASAIEIVDGWLREANKDVESNHKAKIVTEIYTLLLENDQGNTPLPQQINRILRLAG
ncbi:helix-turn-helix domain-containing protein [Labrys neptuniae]|uniref:Helix-turn-helix domain-containing protein n=1 Tax=Labrys neptuniae TaxID=376174 RepID=A0ABV3PGM1_9HYPH